MRSRFTIRCVLGRDMNGARGRINRKQCSQPAIRFLVRGTSMTITLVSAFQEIDPDRGIILPRVLALRLDDQGRKRGGQS